MSKYMGSSRHVFSAEDHPIPWGIRKDTPKITCAKPCVASCPREQCGMGENEDPTVETPEEP